MFQLIDVCFVFKEVAILVKFAALGVNKERYGLMDILLLKSRNRKWKEIEGGKNYDLVRVVD